MRWLGLALQFLFPSGKAPLTLRSPAICGVCGAAVTPLTGGGGLGLPLCVNGCDVLFCTLFASKATGEFHHHLHREDCLSKLKPVPDVDAPPPCSPLPSETRYGRGVYSRFHTAVSISSVNTHYVYRKVFQTQLWESVKELHFYVNVWILFTFILLRN